MGKSDGTTGTALRFTIGKDTEGRTVHAEIGSMRLSRLIVGGCDYDKMNFLRAMIPELTEKYSPAELRLILLGGHYGELSVFGGLPHLISDVVTDPAHAMGALEWGIAEMERRFTILDQKIQEGVRAYGIEEYNAVCTDEEKLPRILIVAEEVNDLLGHGEYEYKINRAFEDRIEYLAMKGHAVGISLIFATEYPSQGSFTRVLRRYSHSCVAFQMCDERASRLILGESGAEKLVGDGDLLYRSWEYPDRTERLRGIHLEADELNRAVNSVKKKFKTPSLYKDAVFTSADTVFSGVGDRKEDRATASSNKQTEETFADPDLSEASACDEEALYCRALAAVIKLGKASVTLIVRSCGTDFDHADKILTRMEAEGHVAPFDGQKLRTVLITQEEFDKKYGSHTR